MTDTETQGTEGLQETPGTTDVNVEGTEQNTETQVSPTWRDDWRQALAKGDDKVVQRLGRFNSPEQIWESYSQLEKRLSSGKYKPDLPEDREATPDELLAYRKAYGIPEKAEDYYKALDPEMVIGEEDKESVDMLMTRLHELNASPDIVKAAIDTYYETIQNVQEQAVEAQKLLRMESEEALRKEWGNEYRSNINAINNFVKGAPQEVQELLAEATLSDGSLAFNNASFIRWLANITREINPHMAVVPSGQGDPLTSVDGQLAELKAIMQKDIGYWHSPANAANKAKYGELLRAKQAISNRR